MLSGAGEVYTPTAPTPAELETDSARVGGDTDPPEVGGGFADPDPAPPEELDGGPATALTGRDSAGAPLLAAGDEVTVTHFALAQDHSADAFIATTEAETPAATPALAEEYDYGTSATPAEEHTAEEAVAPVWRRPSDAGTAGADKDATDAVSAGLEDDATAVIPAHAEDATEAIPPHAGDLTEAIPAHAGDVAEAIPAHAENHTSGLDAAIAGQGSATVGTDIAASIAAPAGDVATGTSLVSDEGATVEWEPASAEDVEPTAIVPSGFEPALGAGDPFRRGQESTEADDTLVSLVRGSGWPNRGEAWPESDAAEAGQALAAPEHVVAASEAPAWPPHNSLPVRDEATETLHTADPAEPVDSLDPANPAEPAEPAEVTFGLDQGAVEASEPADQDGRPRAEADSRFANGISWTGGPDADATAPEAGASAESADADGAAGNAVFEPAARADTMGAVPVETAAPLIVSEAAAEPTARTDVAGPDEAEPVATERHGAERHGAEPDEAEPIPAAPDDAGHDEAEPVAAEPVAAEPREAVLYEPEVAAGPGEAELVRVEPGDLSFGGAEPVAVEPDAPGFGEAAPAAVEPDDLESDGTAPVAAGRDDAGAATTVTSWVEAGNGQDGATAAGNGASDVPPQGSTPQIAAVSAAGTSPQDGPRDGAPTTGPTPANAVEASPAEADPVAADRVRSELPAAQTSAELPAAQTSAEPPAAQTGAELPEAQVEPVRQRRDQRAPADRRRADPEQILAAYPWAYDPRTLREQVDEPDRLWDVADRLTDRLEFAERDNVRAGLLSLRAVVHRILGELDDALADGREGLRHAEADGDLRAVAVARARLAHVLQWRGEFDEADRLYARADSPELPSRLRAEITELAGRSAFEQGRYLEAVNHFERALDVRRGDDPELVERIELALDAISRRSSDGWGPYPRGRDELLGLPAAPVPLLDDGAGLWGYAAAVEPRYAEVQPFAEGVAWVRRPGSSAWELIDQDGELVVPAAHGYLEVGRFAEGVAWVTRQDDGGWFAIDRENQLVVPAGGFEEVRPFRRGLALVRLNGAWGAVDRQGQLAVRPQFRQFATALHLGGPVDGFTEDGLAVIDTGDGVGIVDRGGRLVVAAAYAAVVIHPSAFLVRDAAGLWGALDRKGSPLIDIGHRDPASVVERLPVESRPVL